MKNLKKKKNKTNYLQLYQTKYNYLSKNLLINVYFLKIKISLLYETVLYGFGLTLC